MRRHLSLPSCLLLAVCAALSLNGCSKKQGEAKTETQVVAKVNGDEISIYQVNNQLNRLGPLNEEQSKAAGRQVLSRLIDQQLLLQKAQETKLDRDPVVVQLVDSARREILAKAYLERQLVDAKKPSEQEVTEFYDQHPELFANRRIYKLQEISVAVGLDKLPEIDAEIKNAKGLGDVVAWLKSKNYQFAANSNVRAAEQLPLQLLPKLQQMKDGEVALVPSEHSINIIQVAGVQDQPYDHEKAKPIIEQYFLNKHKTEIAKQEMQKLHTAAKIEYKGAFSDMAQADTDKGNVVKPAAIQPASDKSAPVTTPDSKVSKDDQEHLNKGLTGL